MILGKITTMREAFF